MFAYKNRYGTAILLPVVEPQHISTVTWDNVADENKFSNYKGQNPAAEIQRSRIS
jgi:hypothetical protein